MQLVAASAHPLLGLAGDAPYPVLSLGWLVLLVPLVGWVLAAVALYWVVRLGVRHGMLDARRRERGPHRTPASSEDRLDPA